MYFYLSRDRKAAFNSPYVLRQLVEQSALDAKFWGSNLAAAGTDNSGKGKRFHCLPEKQKAKA
jgi:hypothetical protein